MKVSGVAKYALTITTSAAMLTACNNSGVSALAPPRASSVMPGITHRPYQYISDFGGTILEFDYPKSEASIGSISVTTPSGECTNALFGTGKGTFWVTTAGSHSGGLYEFKVGGTSPIRVFTGDFLGCAIDPATGDLAATSENSGGVIIFRHAREKGKLYVSPLSDTESLGYDNKSNLYVDGLYTGGTFGFVELPKGSKSWKTLSTSNSVYSPGAVQFDGKYITVGNGYVDDQSISGYTCSGTTCTLKRTVALSGASDCDQTWIAKGYVICPDAGNNNIEIFKYPAGGAAIATFGGSFSEPLSSVQAEK
jgi:hypothetical protein